MLRTLDKVAAGVIALAAIVGTIGLIAEVVVILIDVIGRYFGTPLRGAQDITQMGMVVLVFGGMALCDRLNGHIAVDLFERAFPTWLIRLTDILAAASGVAIFLGIAWNMWKSAAISQMLNLSTNIINLPKDWFQYFVVVCCVITAAGMLLRLISLLLGGPLRQAEGHAS
ncbi:TRAP transporter small permease [Pararhodobacter marinus]|uniref:TRAP transporter small permease protein n=1 Tax=Pararhodobacter marinus TaxID=2184063 RepID=A0A2U2CB91_9RHOB|nr:TRAP transporter small permease subunit [Pararhodobacter marinus]PWE29133.1 TRAP transporter small permease [Pararhodobacter marinus]